MAGSEVGGDRSDEKTARVNAIANQFSRESARLFGKEW